MITLKKHWKTIFILLLIASIVYLMFERHINKEKIARSEAIIKASKEVPDVIPPEPIYIEKPGGGNIVMQEVAVPVKYIPEHIKKALRETYLRDTLIAALKKQKGIDDIQIAALTRTIGEAKKKLEERDLINTLTNDSVGILEWQTPYYYSKVNVRERTNDVKYNIVVDNIQTTETTKGFLGTGLFRKKTDYILSTSPDTSATFSGLLQMRTPIQTKYDPFRISAEAGAKYFLKPYNQTDFFTGIRITINPDGRWQPSISGQYILNTVTGQVVPAIEAKVSLKIFE